MTLSTQHIALTKIASLTATGNIEQLKVELNNALDNALDNALTVNQAKSAIEQLYAYCGFPRSINGLGTLFAVVNERKEKGLPTEQGKAMSPRPADSEMTMIGTQVQTKLAGQPVKGALFDFSPNIDRYLKNHLFGDIFADDTLTHQEREIVTIAALASLDGVENQLKAHYHIGRNTGLTDDDLTAIAAELKNSVGEAVQQRAIKVLNDK